MTMLEAIGNQQSNGRATLGRTPIYRMTMSGQEMSDIRVLDTTISLGENAHDTAVLNVSSPDRTGTTGFLDSPISFYYGSATRTELFCGYVTEVTEEHTDSGVLVWTMTVVGPTKEMQKGKPRFLTQRTIPSAVEALVYRSYLGYAGHAQEHVWPTLAQTEGSDWQMITKLATRSGWSIYNRYGVVMLYDPLTLFKENGVAAVLISEAYQLAKDGLDQERSLLEFIPEEESESSAAQQGYKVAYFNGTGVEANVQVATQGGEHSSYRFLNDFVIRNATEAGIYVGSKDSDASEWPQKAGARILGNATLFPGMSVEVLTLNTRFFPGKFNGRWLISAVQHKMDQQSFQTNLVLARPDSTTQVYTGAYAPFWQPLGRSRPTLMVSQSNGQTEGDTPAATAGTWVSSWTNPTVGSAM